MRFSFDAARPVILNGIEDFVNRPDLADRSLFLTLEPIPEEHRRSEQELWAAFETGTATHLRRAARRRGARITDAAGHPTRQAAAYG